jgi:hypothetical protein
MATSLSATIRASITATLTDDTKAIGGASASPPFDNSWNWINGVAVDNADRIYANRHTIVNGAPLSLDLAASLSDIFGNALTFVKVTAIGIKNRQPSTDVGLNLVVGGAAANSFNTFVGAATHTITVGPNGILLLVNPSLAGYAVTAATGDILQIAAASGTIVADVLLIGRSS